MIGGVVFILLTGSDDIYIRAGIVFLGESRLRIQSRGYSVAAVDDGGVAVFKRSWELGRLQFDDFQIFGLEAISETTALTGLTPSFNFSRPFFSRRRRARPPLDGSFGIAMDAPSGRSDRVLCLFENRRRGAR